MLQSLFALFCNILCRKKEENLTKTSLKYFLREKISAEVFGWSRNIIRLNPTVINTFENYLTSLIRKLIENSPN